MKNQPRAPIMLPLAAWLIWLMLLRLLLLWRLATASAATATAHAADDSHADDVSIFSKNRQNNC